MKNQWLHCLIRKKTKNGLKTIWNIVHKKTRTIVPDNTIETWSIVSENFVNSVTATTTKKKKRDPENYLWNMFVPTPQ